MAEERVINLRKERTISLTKGAVENGESIKYAFTGLKWGKILVGGGKPEIVTKTRRKRTGNWFKRLLGLGEVIEETYQEVVYPNKSFGTTYKNVDLDSSILVYDKNKNLIDKLYFGRKSLPGLTHFGDDLVGTEGKEVDVDNETIRINFSELPKEYNYLVVILNSYSHDKFDNLPYMQMRIYESSSEKQSSKASRIFAEYRLDNSADFRDKEALCLGAFFRCGNGWKFSADGTMTGEKSISDMSKGSAKKFVKTL